MTSLEQIVLPLPESRALAEKVKLDTAMVWVRDNDDQHISVVERSRTEEILDLKGEVTVLCGAWVLSELLDAIRAKVPYPVRFESSPFRGKTSLIASWDWGHSECRCERGSTDLLAAYALLLEVAK